MVAFTLTSYLRTLRKKRGYSLREAANLLDISHYDLSRYERHLREVPLPVALTCCLLYQVTAQLLFAGMYDHCKSSLIHRLKLFRRRLVRRISKSRLDARLNHKLSLVTECLAHLSTATI